MAALQAAIDMDKPMWTICGGTQMAITALGGAEDDSMVVAPGSALDLSTHSKDPGRGAELLASTKTWSAHMQGVAVGKEEGGDVFSFTRLPE